MKKVLFAVLFAGLLLGTACKSGVLVKSSPGQVKKETGSQSAKEYAPGQVKKEEGEKSAKEDAPGQVKKEKGEKSAKEEAPGQKKKKD